MVGGDIKDSPNCLRKNRKQPNKEEAGQGFHNIIKANKFGPEHLGMNLLEFLQNKIKFSGPTLKLIPQRC